MLLFFETVACSQNSRINGASEGYGLGFFAGIVT